MPDRRNLCGHAGHAPSQLARPVHARDDHPVVAADLDRPVPQRLHRDERADLHLVPERFEALDELTFLPARPRDHDPHGTTASNERATSSASVPLRRSTHPPFPSARSAVYVVPSWSAATGARHPPPMSATQRRSASTRRRVSPSSARATSSSSPARTCSASAP